MDEALAVDSWLASLPATHKRRSWLTQQKTVIGQMLADLPPDQWAQALDILEQNTMSPGSIHRFVTRGLSLDTITIAANLHDASRDDSDTRDWGLNYEPCLTLAGTFPDDEVGDIMTLLVEYRGCVQVDTPGNRTPHLATVVPELVKLASEHGCGSVGDAGIVVQDIFERQGLRTRERLQPEGLRVHARPSALELRQTTGMGVLEDDDLGDK